MSTIDDGLDRERENIRQWKERKDRDKMQATLDGILAAITVKQQPVQQPTPSLPKYCIGCGAPSDGTGHCRFCGRAAERV